MKKIILKSDWIFVANGLKFIIFKGFPGTGFNSADYKQNFFIIINDSKDRCSQIWKGLREDSYLQHIPEKKTLRDIFISSLLYQTENQISGCINSACHLCDKPVRFQTILNRVIQT
ncbi:MAG TPA: hypothetical protein PLJ84_07105 [Bacteroidales bacterium]|nr:hypothetical protein [Bacteroidales bacterium]HPT02351.1 hypothetical protein [Bacteroidales bacterium]